MSLTRQRREYGGSTLLESRAPARPLPLLRRWLARASRAGVLEPNAMTLATVDARGRPRARMVLLKLADERGFTFYTNQRSAKARELAARPHAALVLWWRELHRQVRIEGRVRRRFEGADVPRPPHWGGYRLVPRAIEFWQGRPDRMHDRLRYTRAGGRWRRARLAP